MLLRILALAGLLAVTTACFGRLAISLNEQIDPRPILPGAVLQQELAIEGDGLLGAAARQAMTQSAQASASPNAGWQFRDNSDGTTVRFRMSRSIAMDASGTELQAAINGDPAKVQVVSSDWFFVRRYRVQVDVSTPDNAASPPTSDAQSQQLAQLMLAGITYDHYLRMPGIVTDTNGIKSDDGRLSWHVSFTSPSSQQTLFAESIYPDLPRGGMLLVLLGGLAGWRLIAMRRRPDAPAPSA